MRNFLAKLHTSNGLLRFLWKERLWWMAPFVLTLLVVGLLLVFAQSSPVIPFMYAAF